MFEEVKERLLEQPESIEHILDAFGFVRIKRNHREIRCAFDESIELPGGLGYQHCCDRYEFEGFLEVEDV